MAELSGSNPIGGRNPINQGGTGGAFQVQGGQAPAAFQRVGESVRGIGSGAKGTGVALVEGLMAKSLSKQQHYQGMERDAHQHGLSLEAGEVRHQQELEQMTRYGKIQTKVIGAQAGADIARGNADSANRQTEMRQKNRIFQSNIKKVQPGTTFAFGHGEHTMTGTAKIPETPVTAAEPTATAAKPASKRAAASKPAGTKSSTPRAAAKKSETKQELTPAQKGAETRRRNREAAQKAASKRPPKR